MLRCEPVDLRGEECRGTDALEQRGAEVPKNEGCVRPWLAVQTLLLLAAFLSIARHGDASCPSPASPATEYSRSSLVFAGIATRVGRVDLDPPSFRELHDVTFLVTGVWKGAIGDTVQVRALERRFIVGQHYLVYATDFRGNLRTYACTRGGLVENALWDRYWLPDAVSFRPGPKVGKVTLEGLFAALAEPDFRSWYGVDQALGSTPEMRSVILTRLRHIVAGEEAGNPVAAARAIGWMGSAGRSAEPELAWALRNSTGEGRAAALGALRTVTEWGSSHQYVFTALEDTSSALLAVACEMTAYLSREDSSVTDRVGMALVPLVHHPIPTVRGHAISALGDYPRAGLTVLNEIGRLRCQDPDPGVRVSARGTWGRLTGRDPWLGCPKGSPGDKERTRR